MADGKFQVVGTFPTTYSDPVQGIVNGVLVRFIMTDYNEVGEIRNASPDVTQVVAKINAYIANRDKLAQSQTP